MRADSSNHARPARYGRLFRAEARHRLRASWVAFAIVMGLVAGCNQSSPDTATRTISRTSSTGGSTAALTLLNVSYDPTREFYVEFNQAFQQHWQEQKGQRVSIDQSHGGAGKQARAVIDGSKTKK